MEGIEVFYVSRENFLHAKDYEWQGERMHDAVAENEGNFKDAAASLAGWYWWACFPGCLPDGEANGPFDTMQEAYKDAKGE